MQDEAEDPRRTPFGRRSIAVGAGLFVTGFLAFLGGMYFVTASMHVRLPFLPANSVLGAIGTRFDNSDEMDGDLPSAPPESAPAAFASERPAPANTGPVPQTASSLSPLLPPAAEKSAAQAEVAPEPLTSPSPQAVGQAATASAQPVRLPQAALNQAAPATVTSQPETAADAAGATRTPPPHAAPPARPRSSGISQTPAGARREPEAVTSSVPEHRAASGASLAVGPRRPSSVREHRAPAVRPRGTAASSAQAAPCTKFGGASLRPPLMPGSSLVAEGRSAVAGGHAVGARPPAMRRPGVILVIGRPAPGLLVSSSGTPNVRSNDRLDPRAGVQSPLLVDPGSVATPPAQAMIRAQR